MRKNSDLQRRVGVMALAGLLALTGCADEPGFPEFRHDAFYQRLRGWAEAFTLRDGQWMEDFGDAAFYGPAYYAHAGVSGYNQYYTLRAAAAHQHNLHVLRTENLVTGDSNELIMAALGAVEYMAATGDLAGLEDLDTMIGGLRLILGLFGGYITPDLAPGYAMDNYGPTTVNGLLALVFLQHAYNLGGETRDDYLQVGRELADRIRQRSWTGEHYVFSDAREGLFLYPNITLLLLTTRLYQLTGEDQYLDQARVLYDAIQPLKVTPDSGWVSPGRYRSPYSADEMGAQTDDYSTLSSQNYAMFALALLYEATGEVAWVRELDGLLDFLEQRLPGEWCLSQLHLEPCVPACFAQDAICVATECATERCQHGVLHHWIDGRLADYNDAEFFCSGCNLQTLFLLWYRAERLHAPDDD